MPYLIDTDIPLSKNKDREAVRPSHLAYLEANVLKILAAGAKLDEGESGGGSFYLIDTEDRDEAEKFIAGDPYALAGLMTNVMITRVRKGFFDKRRIPPDKS